MVLTACLSASPSPLSPTVVSVTPQVTFALAPTSVCRAATQVRFTPEVSGRWIENAVAQWELHAEGEASVLSRGEWHPGVGELLVVFPQAMPLAPGRYRLTLYGGDTSLAEHVFTVSGEAAAVTAFALAMTPNGQAVTRLDSGVRHFYLRYAYAGVCLGMPYWVSVRLGDELICSSNATLPQESGVEIIPCYRKDGAALEEGVYTAEIMLLGEVYHRDTFEVGTLPTPTPLPPTATPTLMPTATPPVVPPTCMPLFAATGLSPEGEPFLPKDRFEWYSQVIYVGTRCENLPSAVSWLSVWYRNGQRVREAGGVWSGGSGTGTVWDSLTGTAAAPFLPPGTYTVSLTLAGSTPLTTTFRLIPYVKPSPQP